MQLTIELEREEDGRWIAVIPVLSGVMAYGASREEVIAQVQALALRVMADRLELGRRCRRWVGFLPFNNGGIRAGGDRLGRLERVRLEKS